MCNSTENIEIAHMEKNWTSKGADRSFNTDKKYGSYLKSECCYDMNSQQNKRFEIN